MIIMEKLLQKKHQELKQLIAQIEKKQAGYPAGSLRVGRDRKHYSYYHYLGEKRKEFPLGKYIPKKDQALIHALAQKDYDTKILKWAKDCCTRLERFMAVYADDRCEDIYEKLSAGRQAYIEPYVLPFGLFAEHWLNCPYKGKELLAGTACFITEKGEKVRSKSEKILADRFYKMNIPYKYECPLALQGYGTVYPDFTLLNRQTRQIWYWEHLGMMEQTEYAVKSVMKIHSYEQNGIFPGKQLILSYEMKNDLDMKIIDALIQAYLL